MAFQSLLILAQMNSSVFGLRGLLNGLKMFYLVLALLFTIFSLGTCKPCSVDGKQDSVQCDAFRSFGEYSNTVFQDFSSEHGNPRTHLNINSICTDSRSFCFPSTLRGLFTRDREVGGSSFNDSGPKFDGSDEDTGSARNRTWSEDYGMFKLFNGGVVSCSLNSRDSSVRNDVSSCRGCAANQKIASFKEEEVNIELNKSGSSDCSSSRDVEISPAVLDWGHKYTYFPSVAFLTVTNTCNNSVLHVYEPFSTDSQFYACNFSETSLRPGETTSICIVYLPSSLGVSSAHLVLQTSSGGFLIQAKGFAIESPYGIHPFFGLDVSSGSPGRRWNRNLSLSNSFDETLYVEEITVWFSISVGQTSIDTEAICSVKFRDSEVVDLPSIEEWLVVRNGQFGLPLFGMRPWRNWEIGPYSTETIMEVDFSLESKGRVFGAFCVKLFRSSREKSDTVVVPLEAEFDGKSVRDVSESILVYLEVIYPYDSKEPFVVISLRNGAPKLLSVVKIIEVEDIKVLRIKYIEGLLLFPWSETQIAVATCDVPVSEPDMLNMYGNCKLVIMTNDSISPQIEVPCRDIIHICSRDSFGYKRYLEIGGSRTVPSGNVLHLTSQIKSMETSEADELVLQNWKSQGTTGGFSVLEDDELLFPMVQVGSHQSKWITVINPSEKPVIMQLILNSGEIIDDCKGIDGLIQPPSSRSMVRDETIMPSRYGFSISDSAVTEAYVQPYSKALFGPVLFCPLTRCEWKSSALIRNNLSGVEWVSLRGFGGSLSLLLHEGFDPVRSIEFNVSLPIPLNLSHVHTFVHVEETSSSCSKPVLKELYAKNTGDLPLEVRKMKVSGKDCALDGFKVHTCSGFNIKPGELSKVMISYQTDFSTSVVHRDLELVLATGILVIPMKGIVPMHILSVCKRSVFWFRVKRYMVATIPVAFLVFLVFCFLFPQVLSLNTHDYLGKSCKGSMPTIRGTGKCACELNLGNCKFSLLPEMDSPINKMTVQVGLADQGTQYLSESQKERESSPSLLSQSPKVERPDTQDSSQTANLRIKTEKSVRRRKKKSAGGNKLAGLFEVSSSHSGNSTPSSPLSPLASSVTIDPDSHTPLANRSLERKEHVVNKSPPIEHQRSYPFSQQKRNNSSGSIQENQPSASTRKPASLKPCLLPSATFPSPNRPAPSVCISLASSSTMAPHARAPGFKICDQKSLEEKALLVDDGDDDRYRYDIWGDHFSRLQLMSRSKSLSKTTDNDSDSFFVKGPQTLVTKFRQPKSISCFGQED